MNSSISNLIEAFFRELSRRKVQYCILRNYEELPDKISHDIDVLIEHRVAENIVLEITTIIKDLGWNIACTQNQNDFFTFICHRVVGNEFKQLKLDIWTDLLWRGAKWIDADYILNNRIQYGIYYIPSPGAEAAVTTLKEIVGGGVVPVKYQDKIQKLLLENQIDFRNCLFPVLGQYVNELIAACLDGNWNFINNSRWKIRKAIRKNSKTRNGFINYYKFLFDKSARAIKSHFKPKGMLVAIVGPDGSGKSTIAGIIAKSLSLFFPEQKIFHTRLQIFPELKSGLGLTNRVKNAISDNTKDLYTEKGGKKTDRSIVSRVAAWVVVGYYTLEFVIGRYVIFTIKRRMGLVVFDRYFYDFFAQPSTRDLIWGVRKVLLFFIPKPDVIIHLVANSEIVYQRKDELSEKEIETQNKYFRRILEEERKCYTIQTDNCDARSVAAKVTDIIVRNSNFQQ